MGMVYLVVAVVFLGFAVLTVMSLGSEYHA
jgi:hypothetical protein